MNKKQKRMRLKKLNAEKKHYKKTGYWSIRAEANAYVREYRTREYQEQFPELTQIKLKRGSIQKWVGSRFFFGLNFLHLLEKISMLVKNIYWLYILCGSQAISI